MIVTSYVFRDGIIHWENMESLCRAVGIHRVRVVDPYDLAACDAAVKEELAAKEPSVIISRRPCALLKYVKHPGPISANPDKCVGCKSCMKIGCPAISIGADKKGPYRRDALCRMRPVPAALPSGRYPEVRGRGGAKDCGGGRLHRGGYEAEYGAFTWDGGLRRNGLYYCGRGLRHQYSGYFLRREISAQRASGRL